MGILDIIYLNNPYKLNPFYAIPIAFGLAFLPHILKSGLVKEKNLKHGKKKSTQEMIANSRLEADLAMDNSPLGIKIAAYAGCHNNGMEALIYFSAALLSAVVTKVPADIVSGAASAFILVRILYTTFYLTPLNGPLRSLAWAIGVWICVDISLKAADLYSKGL
mmetsp:Transcript_4671/g.5120  ORF Transcript_4671/g.5120 Transcript_4671/m.5120 type:complete len:164 (-) Transcript_4671:164-655(-)|eukprot:gene12142-13278_t